MIISIDFRYPEILTSRESRDFLDSQLVRESKTFPGVGTVVVEGGGHLGHGLQGPAEPACAGFVDTDADKPSDKYLDSIFSILVPG